MEFEYKSIRLGEFAKVLGGYAFKSSMFSDLGIPVLKIKNVVQKFVDLADMQCIDESLFNDKLEKYVVNDKDILIAMTGQGSVGRVGRVYLNKNRLILLNQRVGKIITDESKLDSNYLFYILSSERYREILFNAGLGSGQPNLSPMVIESIEIPYVRIEEQRYIGELLSLLDEKVLSNKEMINSFEGLSQALFKRWFIDFEFPNEEGLPYKSSGGKMVDSELGEIPEGWYVAPFKEIMTISSGKRPKNKLEKFDLEHPIPIIGASKIMGYTSDILYEEPILVIGRVGTHGVVQRLNKKCWASDNTLVLKSTFYNFTYQTLNGIDYLSLNRGSTQPLITQTDIKEYLIVKPSNKVLKIYENITSMFLEELFLLEEENVKLQQLRDTLLQKFLSGEIKIPDESVVV